MIDEEETSFGAKDKIDFNKTDAHTYNGHYHPISQICHSDMS